MKYTKEFEKHFGLQPSDSNFYKRRTEGWAACEAFYESRNCKDCAEWREPNNNLGMCGFLNDLVEKDFCCKYWKAAGITKEGYERLCKEMKKIEELRNLREELLQKTEDANYGMKDLTEEEHKQHRKAMYKFFKK